MVETIDWDTFYNRFKEQGKENYFSRDALEALFDFMNFIDPDYILDVDELCEDFCEDPIKDNNLVELLEKTHVVWHDNKKVLYQSFPLDGDGFK